jgi:cyclophilin family peptidyl-prolyl cis-trans isomerase
MCSSKVSLQLVAGLATAERTSDSNNSAFFFLLNDTPQLLARFDNVLVAVKACRAGRIGLLGPCEPLASGDVLGMWYDVVLRLFIRLFAIPSDIDPSGDGVLESPKGFPSPDEGEDETSGCSVSAVVGAAFGIEEPLTPPTRGGTRPIENLEVVDMREAREPGRSGEGMTGAC